MLPIFFITLKGLFRERVFRGILISAVLFLGIPFISTLSMRQVAELSITLSLSLISFILLLLSVFLGGSSFWKDVERRYVFSVLGLPVSRTDYLLGKLGAVAGFVLLIAIVLGLIACAVIWLASSAYPPTLRPVVWTNIFFAIFFDALKYVLLVGIAFLFSTVSTSFFLPIFGTVSIFLVGSATQELYDFIRISEQAFSPLVKNIITLLYYFIPNFGAFDLKVNAVYGISLSPAGLMMTAGYFILYFALVVSLSSILFSRRELR